MDVAYRFFKDQGLNKEAEGVKYTKLKKWKYGTTVRRGMMVELVRKHGLTDRFGEAVYPGEDAATIARAFDRLVAIISEYRVFAAEDPILDPEPIDEQDELGTESQKFAIEAHLRDFLAKNLGFLEPGLKLYEKDGRQGIEFPVTDGRIDILAIDRNGTPVVIELKLSKGRNRVLGQLSYYMAWVDQNLGLGMSRGIIVASDITQDLILAAQRVNGVSLARYRLEFKIEKVS
ncbi:MAG: endonuclease NucS [Tepidisphaeraceae bacterium]